jgi:enoyl-CoA hydratase
LLDLMEIVWNILACLHSINQSINQSIDQKGVEVNSALKQFDHDDGVRCIVIAGSEKAFAAGADIAEMASQSYVDVFAGGLFSEWNTMRGIRKPIIAGVSGFALGGGCELAMMCDIIYASKSARFGQPEIKLGTIPGMGGTQRLTRAVGKSRAMEMVLAGDMFTADELAATGLISRVVDDAKLMEEVFKLADKIAAMSLPSIMLAKEAVNASYEGTLAEGIRIERKLFESTFATLDQKEGMGAFVAKRAAKWQHK